MSSIYGLATLCSAPTQNTSHSSSSSSSVGVGVENQFADEKRKDLLASSQLLVEDKLYACHPCLITSSVPRHMELFSEIPFFIFAPNPEKDKIASYFVIDWLLGSLPPRQYVSYRWIDYMSLQVEKQLSSFLGLCGVYILSLFLFALKESKDQNQKLKAFTSFSSFQEFEDDLKECPLFSSSADLGQKPTLADLKEAVAKHQEGSLFVDSFSRWWEEGFLRSSQGEHCGRVLVDPFLDDVRRMQHFVFALRAGDVTKEQLVEELKKCQVVDISCEKESTQIRFLQQWDQMRGRGADKLTFFQDIDPAFLPNFWHLVFFLPLSPDQNILEQVLFFFLYWRQYDKEWLISSPMIPVFHKETKYVQMLNSVFDPQAPPSLNRALARDMIRASLYLERFKNNSFVLLINDLEVQEFSIFSLIRTCSNHLFVTPALIVPGHCLLDIFLKKRFVHDEVFKRLTNEELDGLIQRFHNLRVNKFNLVESFSLFWEIIKDCYVPDSQSLQWPEKYQHQLLELFRALILKELNTFNINSKQTYLGNCNQMYILVNIGKTKTRYLCDIGLSGCDTLLECASLIFALACCTPSFPLDSFKSNVYTQLFESYYFEECDFTRKCKTSTRHFVIVKYIQKLYLSVLASLKSKLASSSSIHPLATLLQKRMGLQLHPTMVMEPKREKVNHPPKPRVPERVYSSSAECPALSFTSSSSLPRVHYVCTFHQDSTTEDHYFELKCSKGCSALICIQCMQSKKKALLQKGQTFEHLTTCFICQHVESVIYSLREWKRDPLNVVRKWIKKSLKHSPVTPLTSELEEPEEEEEEGVDMSMVAEEEEKEEKRPTSIADPPSAPLDLDKKCKVLVHDEDNKKTDLEEKRPKKQAKAKPAKKKKTILSLEQLEQEIKQREFQHKWETRKQQLIQMFQLDCQEKEHILPLQASSFLSFLNRPVNEASFVCPPMLFVFAPGWRMLWQEIEVSKQIQWVRSVSIFRVCKASKICFLPALQVFLLEWNVFHDFQQVFSNNPKAKDVFSKEESESLCVLFWTSHVCLSENNCWKSLTFYSFK